MGGGQNQGMTTDLQDEEIIVQVVDKLTEKFPEAPATQVDSIVREEFSEISNRPVRDYLSVLTERAARLRVKTLVT